MQPSRAEPLPRLSSVTPRLFYGWWVALGGCLISLVCAGVGFYSQGVLLDALCAERGWSRANVAGASGLYFVVSGFAGLAVGRLIDRVGARAFIALGALLLAASLVAVGGVESQAMLYVWFPLMAIGSSFAGPVPTAAIVTRWFVALRARAMTVSQTGVSLGGILLVPLATWLIHERGLPVAMTALAAIVVGVALPVVAFVLRSDPARHGLRPDGGRAAAADGHGGGMAEVSFRTRDAMRTASFWGIMLAFSIGLFAQVGFLAHQLAWLRERLGARDAAIAVSATAFGSVVGRFLVGPVADRIEKRRIGVGLFLVQAVATLAFAHVDGTAGAIAASFVFGMTMGNIFMMQPLLVGEFYGVVAFASVLGALQLGTQLASGLGPWAVGLAYDRLGGYQRAFEGLAALAIIASAVLSRVRPPAPRR
jgi:MFS family permease